MQNLKYHIINILAVTVFSYTTAVTANDIIKYNISPTFSAKKAKKQNKRTTKPQKKSFETAVANILQSKFFKEGDAPTPTDPGGTGGTETIDNLTLVGTITGPSSISRAMIVKKGEKTPKIFALWKINEDITNDVYGNKLIKILNFKVYLDKDGEKKVLELYAKKQAESSTGDSKSSKKSGGRVVKKTLSRAEIQQKVLNNLDNAMKGLVAGPYRENGKVTGFRLKKVRPSNILYKMGARSGDIVRRINGLQINSTEKLYQMWGSLKSESKIAIDIDRGGKSITFDLNITD